MAGVGSISGSQIDVQGMVSQLMAVERRPIEALQGDSRRLESKISALGSIKSKVAAVQSAAENLSKLEAIDAWKAEIDATAGLRATAGTGASAGTYQVQVMQLAQAQTLVTSGLSSPRSSIGSGAIQFTVGSGPPAKVTTIEIGSANNSLYGIRDAINAAAAGVRATVVQDGSEAPHRLVLTTSATGASEQMDITVSGDSALQQLLEHHPDIAGARRLQQTLAPQDALLHMDGIELRSPTNTFRQAVEGLTLNASKIDAAPTTLRVERDRASLEEKLNNLVSSYNDLSKSIRSSTAYDINRRSGAVLYGESGLRGLLNQTRNLIASPVGTDGAFNRLSQIGVEFQKDGSLSINASRLSSVLDTNPDDVQRLLAARGVSNDSGIELSRFSANAKPGSYSVQVDQLPASPSVSGTPLAFPMALVSGVNDGLSLRVGGAELSLSLGDLSVESTDALVASLQSRIRSASAGADAATRAMFDGLRVQSRTDGSLEFTHEGVGSSVNIRASGAATASLLGLSPTVTDGVDVAGTIAGVVAAGVGRTLTAAQGSAADGVSVRVLGGGVGSRGSVALYRGLGDQLQRLLDGYLADTGPIQGRTEGLRASISRIDDRIERLEDRMTRLQKQYTQQFTALDVTLATLTTTSNALGQQLTALSASQRSE